MSNSFLAPKDDLVLGENYNHKKRNRSIEERVSSLEIDLKLKLQRLSQEGKIEEFFNTLNQYGISLSEQQEYASHFMREFKIGLRFISWTKERLMYLTAILENTLNSKNPKLSSAENMIRNYLIFSKIFEDQEGFTLRFGQFDYVIRGIFRGVKTREDIFRIIQDHKTFGEARITREEAEKFIREKYSIISDLGKEFSEKIEKYERRLKELKEIIQDAIEEEERSKGLVWSSSYTPPQQYEFPNYVFQTGSRRGLNTAIGRSSWEVMFLAFSDVINKIMENQINQRMELSDEEKRELIKKRRIELLYEPFDFPIGIRKEQNSKERIIIYRPDFIDINRWRVIEIKGPLTPEAIEKMQAFRKYYIDQDFSNLSEEERIIMIRLVRDKLTQIKNWCEENGYPVYDSFNDFQVFGAYRWDKDLNNFNKYEGVREMKGISEETKKSLQKGLIRFIEEQIEKGKYPDIRPKGYVSVTQLKSIIETRRKKGFRVIDSIKFAKPYLPEIFIENIEYKDNLEDPFEIIKEGMETNQKIADYVLDTLPITKKTKEYLLSLNLLNFYLKEFFAPLLSNLKTILEDNDILEILKDKKICKMHTNFYISHIVDNLKEIIKNLSDSNSHLLETNKIDRNELDAAINYIKNFIFLIEKNIKKDILIIDSKLFETVANMALSYQILTFPIFYTEKLFLGKYFYLYDKRLKELNSLLIYRKYTRDKNRIEERFLEILKENRKEILLNLNFKEEFAIFCEYVAYSILSRLKNINNLFIDLSQYRDIASIIINYLYLTKGRRDWTLSPIIITEVSEILLKIFKSPDNLLNQISNNFTNYDQRELSVFLDKLLKIEKFSFFKSENLKRLYPEIDRYKIVLVLALELAVKKLLGPSFEINKLLQEELSSPLLAQTLEKLYSLYDETLKQK